MAREHHQMRSAMARFPLQKTLASFDFKFPPSPDPKQIRELATGRCSQSGANLLLRGPPGAGKRPLAIAPGIKACAQGVRTRFATAAALLAALGKALTEGQRAERLKRLTQPPLPASCWNRARGTARASFYRAHRSAAPKVAASHTRPVPARALGANERAAVIELLHQQRLADSSVREVYAGLLDDGRYLCSIAAM